MRTYFNLLPYDVLLLIWQYFSNGCANTRNITRLSLILSDESPFKHVLPFAFQRLDILQNSGKMDPNGYGILSLSNRTATNIARKSLARCGKSIQRITIHQEWCGFPQIIIRECTEAHRLSLESWSRREVTGSIVALVQGLGNQLKQLDIPNASSSTAPTLIEACTKLKKLNCSLFALNHLPYSAWNQLGESLEELDVSQACDATNKPSKGLEVLLTRLKKLHSFTIDRENQDSFSSKIPLVFFRVYCSLGLNLREASVGYLEPLHCQTLVQQCPNLEKCHVAENSPSLERIFVLRNQIHALLLDMRSMCPYSEDTAKTIKLGFSLCSNVCEMKIHCANCPYYCTKIQHNFIPAIFWAPKPNLKKLSIRCTSCILSQDAISSICNSTGCLKEITLDICDFQGDNVFSKIILANCDLLNLHVSFNLISCRKRKKRIRRQYELTLAAALAIRKNSSIRSLILQDFDCSSIFESETKVNESFSFQFERALFELSNRGAYVSIFGKNYGMRSIIPDYFC